MRNVDDLEFPPIAEIVIEGYVELGEFRTEGPFGDHTGFYSLEDEYPVFHVTCITHRKEPDLSDDNRGAAPRKTFTWATRSNGFFSRRCACNFRKSPTSACRPRHFSQSHGRADQQRLSRAMRESMNGIWSLRQAMFTKVVVVVDHDVNVHNYREVVWKALCAIDPAV